MNPAIVISAYNRPHTLQRLLNSLAAAVYDDDSITLVISIDKTVNTDVQGVAEHFEWRYGNKEIITHEKHLGLKRHILYCGALTKVYDAVIVLEDDLIVSPFFYAYAQHAYTYYKQDTSIAGVSLYNYQVAESCFYPFKAIDDGSDVYFMQVASSWGQLWTKHQWQHFEEWFDEHPDLTGHNIPEYLKKWGSHSWKKHFIDYLIANSKYFVFPRLSLSTNFEEAGTNATEMGIFQVPLQLTKKSYEFRLLRDSNSVYDSSFEPLPKCINALNPTLSSYNYEVDLYGTKKVTPNSFTYILSSKKAAGPEISFSSSLIPLAANIALNLPGNKIGLYKKAGNQFSDGNLQLQYYLAGHYHQKAYSISVVIPVKDLHLSDLKVTIDSIITQDTNILECLIVANSFEAENLRSFVSAYQQNLRLIISETEGTLADLLALGFQRVTNEIVTWVLPGNFYYNSTFQRVQLIFKSHPTLSWTAGLDPEPTQLMDQQKSVELEKYRLSPNAIHKQLLKRKLNTDTQLQFFRKHCITDFTVEHISLHDLFFQLSNIYQCFLMVYQPGIRSNRAFPNISATEANRLLITYKHFNSESKSLPAKIAAALGKNNLIPKRLRYALRLHFESLPDVLRFDDTGAAYLNKY